MPENGTWWGYVTKHAHGESQRQIAANISADPSAVGRWKDSVRPRAENVIEFARQYGRSPIEALIYAGYIERNEAGKVVEIIESPDDLADEAVLATLTSRLKELRRFQRGRDDMQPGSFPRWDAKDPRVRDVKNTDERG